MKNLISPADPVWARLRRSVFSLIELLVVIAIIAILAAMLCARVRKRMVSVP